MLIFLYSALIVVFDQLFKQWIILTHSVGQETVLIPGFFSLFRLHNPGAAFGFMAGLPWWVLAAIQLIAVVILVMIILRYTEGFWGSLGLASVLGGAVGNLVDRVIHQYVVDMFRFTFVDFAIFNLADVFITMGFLIFLCHYIAQTFRSGKKGDALADDDDIIDDEYDQPEASIDSVVDDGSVAAAVPIAAPVDFEALAQVEPVAYDVPIAEIAADGQVAAQPIAQPVPQAVPPVAQPIAGSITETPPQPLPQAAQPTPQPVQPVLQPVPQAVQPIPQPMPPAAQPVPQPVPQETVSPPAPQMIATPQGDLTQPVDPATVFGSSTNAEAAKPLLDPSSHTGPLPAVEIAPLLDQVYGGQYLKKQEATAQTAAAPVAQSVPVAPTAPAAPQPTPVAQPAPAVPTAPVTPPTPVTQPPSVPVAPTAPAPVAATPAVSSPPPVVQQPTPVAQPMPTEYPTPVADVPSTSDNPETMLDALAALESELLGENALDDYNADKLLGEYGFESESKD